MAAGLHERLLEPVNALLKTQGLILKRVTLVDAPLLQAARRAPRLDDPQGSDPEANNTVKAAWLVSPQNGAHTLIRKAELGPASEHDSRRFDDVGEGDEQMGIANKA